MHGGSYATGFDIPQLPGYAQGGRPAAHGRAGTLAREQAANQWG